MLEKWMLIPILVAIFLAGWLIPPWYYRRKDKKRGKPFEEDNQGGEVTLADILKELREMRLELRVELRDLRGDLRATMRQVAVTIIIAVVGLSVAF